MIHNHQRLWLCMAYSFFLKTWTIKIHYEYKRYGNLWLRMVRHPEAFSMTCSNLQPLKIWGKLCPCVQITFQINSPRCLCLCCLKWPSHFFPRDLGMHNTYKWALFLLGVALRNPTQQKWLSLLSTCLHWIETFWLGLSGSLKRVHDFDMLEQEGLIA